MRGLVVGLLVLVVGLLMGGGVAQAQSAGVEQYGADTVTGAGAPDVAPVPTPTPPATTTTTPGSATGPDTPGGDAGGGVESVNEDGNGGGDGGGGDDGAGPGAGTADPSAPGGAAGSAPAGTAGAGSAPTGVPQAPRVTGPPATRWAFLQFGSQAGPKLRGDITEALDRVGLELLFGGWMTRQRFETFLGSSQADALSTGSPRALGRAFGAQLVTPTSALTDAFPVVFGPRVAFVPVIRAVLTRRADLTADEIAFQLGVAEGLKAAGVPVAYVERTNTKPTFVADYEKLDVPVVDDVDTDKGKQRLGAIMLGQDTAAARVDADRSAATIVGGTDEPGTGLAPYGLLLLLAAGGGVWVLRGLRAGRSR